MKKETLFACPMTALLLVFPLPLLAQAPSPAPRQSTPLIAPATPLVAVDPYFSIWSPGNHLAQADTMHWTGKPHRLTSLARIDGKAFRLLGTQPSELPTLKQNGYDISPTRTSYVFTGEGVQIMVSFMTPALPDDLDVLSWPVTYLTWSAQSVDGKPHDVALYFDANAEIVVNEPRQQVEWLHEEIEGLRVLKAGSVEQPVLAKKGDDLRIDWGYLYVAALPEQKPFSDVAPAALVRGDFASNGTFRAHYDGPMGSVEAGSAPVGAFAFHLGEVGKDQVFRHIILAYDDRYSIQYMRQNLRPYWRRHGWEAADLLKAAKSRMAELMKRTREFDMELQQDLVKAGGPKYAQICNLAYRQCFAAGKFVADANSKPLQFCKENHSNGCIGTSDVFYPMSPQFLLFGPTLAKSFLVPFMNYAASDRWKFPFAPHDLGTYPKANGQVYGGGERTEQNQMPVEESGNLLLLCGAIAQMEGHADFAGVYWKQLEQWAQYLKAKGFDPENQLCTDDFAGHLAHNVNLSAKAICGLGAFAKLCAMRGDKAKSHGYSQLARQFAARWVQEARDGDHYKLAFDRPGTWSQKYNLVWDRILGLNLFPADVLRTEMDYYKKAQNKYGLPLDNRKEYTKLDWILWTATLTQERSDFEALVDPVFLFLSETPERSPMTDWYQTKSARKVGFTARPVVGGVFLQMLCDKAVWSKWANRDKTQAKDWAPMPKPPTVVTVVPSSQKEGATWRYTTDKPSDDWFKASFDDSSWKTGTGGFGTPNTPGAVVRTEWNTPTIWLRREVQFPSGDWKNLHLMVHHDEDVTIYINGVQAASARGYTTTYEELPLSNPAAMALKPGKNTIAVHCRQTRGGQYIDVGIVDVTPAK